METKLWEFVVAVEGVLNDPPCKSVISGVLVEGGLVLSCHHALYGFTEIFVKKPNSTEFKSATIVFEDASRDLILLDDGEKREQCAVLGLDDDVYAGIKTHTMFQFGFDRSFDTTNVSYGNQYSVVGDILTWLVETGEYKCRDHEFLSRLNDNLPLVQIDNHYPCFGAIGSPIFDYLGRLVGILNLTTRGFDFGIMASSIKDFIESYNGLISSKAKIEVEEDTSLEREKMYKDNAGLFGEKQMTGGDAEN